MNKLLLVITVLVVCLSRMDAQMPPPGYERAVKIEEKRCSMPALERDSITVIDTAMIFDPNTYESEIVITKSRLSLKDYLIQYLNMNNPEQLLDGNPRTIIDPRTYEEITIKLHPSGRIDTIPK